MVYDAQRQKVVVFGGRRTSGFTLNDTWEWDGTAWTNMMPTSSPSSRQWPAMAFDPGRGVAVMHGGMSGTSSFYDTWEWDGTWHQVNTPAYELDWFYGSPAINFGDTMTYDALNENVMTSNRGVLRYESGRPHEVCALGFDVDGDGLAGCADPDCWGYCTPLCAPGATCDPAAPHCGDGVCSAVESCRLCPADCGACPLVCGDFHCDPGEDATSCPGDCPP
jgi:hypothetical protein